MLIPLYNDNWGETPTEIGSKFRDKIFDLLSPLIKEAAKKNWCLRDTESLIHSEVSCIIAGEALRRAIVNRKKEREAAR